MNRIITMLATTACLALAPQAAEAQEFRVLTVVRNLAARQEGDKVAPITTTTLTLFRQRKVYDYIESLGEVIIYEPGANQFTIVNTRRHLVTTVNFDEVKQKLRSRKPEIENYIAALRQQNHRGVDNAIAAFEFQLNPQFEQSFDQAKNVLSLESPRCVYRVECDPQSRPEQAAQYLGYADWIARLNCVLHPSAMFPEPRLELNKSLRRYNKLPVRVELRSELDGLLHLSAEHHIAPKLMDRDRTRITAWESAVNSPSYRHVVFKNYQEVVLAAR